MNMRILVATDQWFPDLMGGIARFATETSIRWARAGHEVVVLAPRHFGRPTEERIDGLLLRRVLPRGRLPKTLTDAVATRRVADRMAERDFHVMVAHTPNTAFGLLRSAIDAPLVYVFHADPALESRHQRSALPFGWRRLARVVVEQRLSLFERSSLRRSSSVAVLSEYMRGLAAAIDSEVATRAQLVSGAVDTDVFTPEGREDSRVRLGVDPQTRLVFTVRRLVPRMGLAQLIDAAAILGDIAGLRVVIAGRGALERELRQRRDGLGLEERVSFVGHVPDDDLPHWHRAADLFVLPTMAHEGFGLVTAEALASGTPVVGTPIGATPELLLPLDPRLVSRGTDAEALADAIRTGLHLATPEFRQRCRQYAEERLSWKGVGPSWDALLDHAARFGRRSS
jgi:glycosyltransferase involved in cell wall biosynthesis